MDRKRVIGLAFKFAKEISSFINFDKIVLFGSYAKGSANEDSDIDIAVLVDNYDGDVLELSSKLWLVAGSISDYIEPVLLDYNDDATGFIDEVLNTGIIVAE